MSEKISNIVMFKNNEDGSIEKIGKIQNISEFEIETENPNDIVDNTIASFINSNREISVTINLTSRNAAKFRKNVMGFGKCKGPARYLQVERFRKDAQKLYTQKNDLIENLYAVFNGDTYAISESEYFQDSYPIDITGLPCHNFWDWLILCLSKLREDMSGNV